MDKIGQSGRNWTIWTKLHFMDKIGQSGQNWTIIWAKLDKLEKILDKIEQHGH